MRGGSGAVIPSLPTVHLGCSGIVKQRALRFEASYEPSVAEAFGNLLSSPAYLTPAFLKVEPSSMNFRC
jgi:hypothetical protein